MKSNYKRMQDYLKIAALNGTLHDMSFELGGCGVVLKKVNKDFKGTLIVPEFVDEIGSFAAENIKHMDEVVTFGNLKCIRQLAFCFNRQRIKIHLAEGLEEIEDRAFDECNLEELIIPESVKELHNGLSGCMGRLKLLSIKGELNMDPIYDYEIKHIDTIIINKENKKHVMINDPWCFVQWV